MSIATAKEKINHMIGEVGLLIYPTPDVSGTPTLDLSTGKLDFSNPPAGWLYYGLTSQETKMSTDVQMYESKVGVPEFTLKRFLVGVEGTVSGNFLEVDREIHDLLSGNGSIKNLGPTLTAPVGVTAVDAATKKITIAAPTGGDATKIAVGNTFVIDVTANIATSGNVARITRITKSTNWDLYFEESWFRATPTTSMVMQGYQYGVSQLAASQLNEKQALLVYETREGVQFVYHFPRIIFTPNTSPEFPTTNQVFRMPFEFKLIGIDNTQHGDGSIKVLGYFYELFNRH